MLLGILTLLASVTEVPRKEELIGWAILLSGIAESVHAFNLRAFGFLIHVVSRGEALPLAAWAACGAGLP
jgi:uncharacterized membrane protein HdeD (DUF308 family)